MSSFANIAWTPQHHDVASAKAGGAGPTVGDREVEGQTSDRIGQRPLLPTITLIYFFDPKSDFLGQNGEILPEIESTINECQRFIKVARKNEKELIRKLTNLHEYRLPDLHEKTIGYGGLIVVGNRRSLRKGDLNKMKMLNANYLNNSIYFATYTWLLDNVVGDNSTE